MCVAQFREMVNASRSKLREDFTKDDIIDWNRAPYKGKQGYLYYTTSLSKVKKLASGGNEYALRFIKNHTKNEMNK